ncbi:MAG: hypothetical protein KDA27_24590 [Candidatus Eisenbacteria bacterium]|uniref:PepSY domain-containing protein n=1 Tax=Eiseniibacteriota bacterium TaxID=2212470 RepID=A0A956NHA6_UNCEI|nr:hypothetical protein [Candidatus Eisenbacteria bacterium]
MFKPVMKTVSALACLALVAFLPGVLRGENGESEDAGETERVIALEQVPEAARKVILQESAGYTVVEVDEVTQGDAIYYEAEWIVGGNEVEVAVDAEGKILGREVEPANEDDDEGAEGSDDDR